MSDIQDVNQCVYSTGNEYLFDTNIWIHLFAPNVFESQTCTNVYTRMLNNIISNQCNIYTNNMIVSEIANKIAHDEFNLLTDDPDLKEMDYKTFRETEHFEDTAFLISTCIRKIAMISRLCDLDRTDNELLYEFADKFADGKYDFNDMVFTEICKKNNLTLVTHDGDFKDCGVQIITANKRMLNSN